MSGRPGRLRRAWRALFSADGAAEDAPATAGLASELLTLRVRTIYTTDPRPELLESSNRQRLFALSRVYARYLDRLAGTPTPRDLFGGMTTFHELSHQATGLLAAGEHTGAELEILTRIERESTRIIREVFHPRRRAWLRASHASEAGASGAAMDEGALETAAMAPVTHTVELRGATMAPSPRETPPEDAALGALDLAELDELPDIGVGPIAFVELNEDIPAHEDPDHDLVQADPEWLRKLYAANADWDNELMADGQTTLSGVAPELLPEALRTSRRYPPIDLPRRQELLLQSALDLGTDIVALHTTLSLTGDVVTRISPHLPADHRALFLSLHKDGTSNAMAHWSNIIQALQTLLGGVLDAGLRRTKG